MVKKINAQRQAMTNGPGVAEVNRDIWSPRFPKTALRRFVTRRTMKSSVIWGLVFGSVAASSIVGFASLYTTYASRLQLAVSLGNNAGLKVLFGNAYHIETVGGFTAWRGLGVIIIIGVIWALLIATKSFRGEEEAGRLEIFLAGQTTQRRAAANILAGIGTGLVTIFILTSLFTYAGGQTHGLHFTLASSLFFGLAAVSGPAEFLAVGAFLSQLAPTRKRAAMLAAIVFGASFVARAAADTDRSLRWLLNVTPLGWIEKLHALTDNNALWLLPIAVFTIVLGMLTVYFAGKRDLGSSLQADSGSARPRTKLLNTPLGLAVREERTTAISWLIGAGLIGFFYGFIAKTATEIITTSSKSKGVSTILKDITKQSSSLGIKAFLGIMFLLLTITIMVEVTNLVGAIREDEAEGYLDNLLVRPVSRLRWLGGRLVLITISVLAAAMLGGVFGWIGAASQHSSIPFHEMVIASINVLPSVIFLLGLGLFVLGVRPRLTTSCMYATIAWSFLVEMIGSAVKLNHYILDTSVLNHIALAPAVNPNWTSAMVLVLLGIGLLLSGITMFNARDIEGE